MSDPSDAGAAPVSIIIRAFNEEDHLGRLLDGIFRQKVDFAFEVVVVDSGSTDRTLEIARAHPVRVTHIAPDEFSFGRSLNRGIAAATGRVCAIVSAHCYPMDDLWLAHLVEPFSDERTALVYGRQRGRETTKYSEEQVFARWFPEDSVADYQIPFCNNANSAIRRSVWESHPFDEALTGLEDIDWARRVRGEGHRISYSAQAGVFHIHDESWQEVYNRYYREALAYRQIYADETFRFLDFVRFFAMNTVGDALHALRDGCLARNVLEIPTFRFLQFWATYRAHTRKGISKQMQRQLYYPRVEFFRRKAAARIAVPAVAAAPAPRIVDISRSLSAELPVWPGAAPFSLEWKKAYAQDGVNESHLSLNTHTGTHMDAPYHFSPDGARLGGVALDALVGPADVLQYFGAGPIDRAFLESAGLPQNCERVLIRTRNSLPRRTARSESSESSEPSSPQPSFDEDFVALSREAAQWIVDRGLLLVGVDGPSIQPFHDADDRVHEIVLGSGVVALEGLDLARVDPGRYRLVALPLDIPEAEGAPVRAILLHEEMT